MDTCFGGKSIDELICVVVATPVQDSFGMARALSGPKFNLNRHALSLLNSAGSPTEGQQLYHPRLHWRQTKRPHEPGQRRKWLF